MLDNIVKFENVSTSPGSFTKEEVPDGVVSTWPRQLSDRQHNIGASAKPKWPRLPSVGTKLLLSKMF